MWLLHRSQCYISLFLTSTTLEMYCSGCKIFCLKNYSQCETFVVPSWMMHSIILKIAFLECVFTTTAIFCFFSILPRSYQCSTYRWKIVLQWSVTSAVLHHTKQKPSHLPVINFRFEKERWKRRWDPINQVRRDRCFLFEGLQTCRVHFVKQTPVDAINLLDACFHEWSCVKQKWWLWMVAMQYLCCWLTK